MTLDHTSDDDRYMGHIKIPAEHVPFQGREDIENSLEDFWSSHEHLAVKLKKEVDAFDKKNPKKGWLHI